MDYVKPYGVVDSMLAGGALKLSLPRGNLCCVACWPVPISGSGRAWP